MIPPDFDFRWTLDDGTDVTIRPIRPDDSVIEQEFVRSLSLRSSSLRFFTPIRELSPAALEKFTHTNYPKEMALIATIGSDGSEREIGVARYAPTDEEGRVEFAVVVADDWQGKGIATQLLRHLFGIASDAGINSIEGSVLRENERMLKLAKDFGFKTRIDVNDPHVIYVYKDIQHDHVS